MHTYRGPEWPILVDKWINEWLKEFRNKNWILDDWTNECSEWLKEWMNEGKKERMKVEMKKWMCKEMIEWHRIHVCFVNARSIKSIDRNKNELLYLGNTLYLNNFDVLTVNET